MKEYCKPMLEFIELRQEESLACNGSEVKPPEKKKKKKHGGFDICGSESFDDWDD